MRERERGEGATLVLGHLYPEQLNVYGDRGNILTLTQRCAWRGIRLEVTALELGAPIQPDAFDMLFIGGGQDREQEEVAKATARCVGNVALAWAGSTLVGFENHGGRTYLGPQARALGRVLAGHGNNGEDHREGCVHRNVFGTYVHGSLLPKNPHFADHLLHLALARRFGDGVCAALMTPLDDGLEWQAHDVMLRRLGLDPGKVRSDSAVESTAAAAL